MITKPFILVKDNYRISVLILRDHGRSLETGASLTPRVSGMSVASTATDIPETFTIDAGGARANGVPAGLNGGHG